ncbi:MAG: endonuclease/exonuclease/phosphatase family protein [Candidatus Polarisedimenticolia bacterium]
MTRNAPAVGLLSVLILLLLVAVAGPPVEAADGERRPEAPVRLRVLNINIFYGGDELNLTSGTWCNKPDGCPVTLDKVVEAIRVADPDIVGLEEAERNTRVIGERLGMFYSERMQVLSRYPLIDPPGGDSVYLFVALAPGRIAAIANVHLPADPYGPYIAQEGATPEEVRALEVSLRLPAIRDQLRLLPPLAARGIPVFLMGDFNSPSHLDWTEAVAAVRPEVRYPFDWPVGRALADAGFRDSFRVVHPDPVAVPGFTWTPGGPESIADEVHDRIDWVLATGPATALDSRIVGEVGGPDVSLAVDPYPTDHRGVVSTFDVVPAGSPVLVAVEERRRFTGDLLGVVFHAPGGAGERIAIVPAGGSAAAAVASQPTGSGRPTDGRVVFATAGLAPAAYEAALLDGRGQVLSRSPFWLYAPGTPTTVATSRSVYVVGETIGVSWAAAPGMRWDWLGIYKPGDSDTGNPNASDCNTYNCGGNGRYLLYEYTRATIEGTGSFSAASFPGWLTWPLQPGTYEIRLLLDDGYRSIASSAPFQIVLP